MLRVRSLPLAAIVLFVVAGGIGLSMGLGYWITQSSRIPISFSDGEFEGSYNPADIRGSYTLADIEASFEIPVDVLARSFGVDGLDNPGEFRASKLEEMYGEQADGGEIGTDSLRLFVSLYSGLPYAAEESTRFPATALAELDPRLATADMQALESRIVADESLAIAVAPELAMLSGEAVEEVEPGLPAERTAGSTEGSSAEHDEDAAIIRGKTTFAEVLGWGLNREQIEEVLGMEMGPRLMTVRDFAFENDLEFGTVRTELQTLLEADDESVSQ